MAVITTAPADVLVESLRREFIPFLREELHFNDWAATGTLETHGGSKQLRWLELNKFTQDETGGLTEADATDGEITTLSVATHSATVAEYGAWSKIGSLADMAATVETRRAYTEGFGEHGARTIDTLIRNAADDTTTFLISGETAKNTGQLATTETATAQDIAVITGIFRGNDAKPHMSNGMYVVIVHSEVEQDLVTDVTTTRLSWSEVNKHVPGLDGQQKIIKGSPGAIYGTMVLVSNNIATATLTSTVTAYKNIALARNGVDTASFRAMTPRGSSRGARGPQIMVKTSGSNDTSNPLSMFDTIGWKTAMGQTKLGNNRALVYYSAK